ncbi:MAG: hypothetical protein WCW30_00090, partial [Candidatus Gracilibacteria bacterium]
MHTPESNLGRTFMVLGGLVAANVAKADTLFVRTSDVPVIFETSTGTSSEISGLLGSGEEIIDAAFDETTKTLRATFEGSSTGGLMNIENPGSSTSATATRYEKSGVEPRSLKVGALSDTLYFTDHGGSVGYKCPTPEDFEDETCTTLATDQYAISLAWDEEITDTGITIDDRNDTWEIFDTTGTINSGGGLDNPMDVTICPGIGEYAFVANSVGQEIVTFDLDPSVADQIAATSIDNVPEKIVCFNHTDGRTILAASGHSTTGERDYNTVLYEVGSGGVLSSLGTISTGGSTVITALNVDHLSEGT